MPDSMNREEKKEVGKRRKKKDGKEGPRNETRREGAKEGTAYRGVPTCPALLEADHRVGGIVTEVRKKHPGGSGRGSPVSPGEEC